MSQKRISALDVARSYLFEAQDGLSKAARTLSQHGMASDGTRAVANKASSMSGVVKAMKETVRKAHEAALTAERGDGGNGRGGWGW